MAKKTADFDDVLKVIADLSDHIDGRFNKLEADVFRQGEDIRELKADVAGVKEKVNHVYGILDSHMKRIEDILTTKLATISRSASNLGFFSSRTR